MDSTLIKTLVVLPVVTYSNSILVLFLETQSSGTSRAPDTTHHH